MRLPHVHVHTSPIAAWRRLLLALGGACAGIMLAHGYFAATLVTRGDDIMKLGHPLEALRYYERAHWWDPGWEVAADRIGFTASTMRSPAILRRGAAVAREYLARDPGSTSVRWDLAICELHLGRRAAALSAFRRLAADATRRADPQAARYRDIAYHLERRQDR